MKSYVLYSRLSDKETVFETWGASTKHPDAIFHFSDFTKTAFIPAKDQVLPWLLECASKMTFPMHSAWIAMWALELYEG